MPKFKFVARDAGGKRVEQTVEAASREEVMSNLRRDNLTVLSITEAGGGGAAAILTPGKGKRLPTPHVKAEDLVVFTRQFATMISAGIAVLECLDILMEQAEDPGFKAALHQVIEDVRGGADLSAALGKHPRIWERIYVNMIRAGEASGQLDVILVRLAEYMEATEKLKREIKGAMTYPVISLTMIFGITIFLLVFIIPKFQEIFKALKVDLPLPTVMVLGLSRIMSTYWLQGILILVAAIILIRWWKKTESGGYMWDKLMLKLPIFGQLFQKVALSRFARTFSTLLKSGVAILGALEIVASTAGNRVLEEAINKARDSIRQGEPLAKPLAEYPVFPPMVVRMIAIGERSGALEQLLEKISQFYDEQVSATVEALTSLIEPLMIGIMGLVVGGIVLSVFLPIFKIQEALRRK
ncbi:MAG: type II secretion system F family protein [Planctomycetota bacterium]|nr:type II secretion system F family protein [Planctomycetota bacterium]